MNKLDIRQEAYRRMIRIEEIFGDGRQIPIEVMALFRLMKLIYSASFQEYFSEWGFLPINAGDVNDAKQDYFQWGPLTSFEKEVCDLLNQMCDRREEQAKRKLPVAELMR